jgi:hypothetical protein
MISEKPISSLILRVVGNCVGYIPIRVMFYYPNRQQAMRIQQTLKTLYQGIGGHYYYGDGAWEYVFERTGVDLKAILEQIANERVPQKEQL